jgi:PAS domain S-box-containing protein
MNKTVALQQQISELKSQLDAVERTQAVVSFDLVGNIIDCNDLFCHAVGYSKNELIGKHHSFLVDPIDTPSYGAFWEGLRKGHARSGEFKRVGKNGKVVYLQAVKFATDVTLQHANAMLLSNMLPVSIANELRLDPHRRIAQTHDAVSILFADVVGFTAMSERCLLWRLLHC